MRIAACVISFLLLSGLQSTQTLIYSKVGHGSEVTTTYTINKTSDLYTIQATNTEQTTDIEGAVPYRLLSFTCRSQKNKDYYTFSLKDNKLVAEGELKGQRLHESYSLGNTLWIQEFNFGLLPLLTSNKKSINFEILHPKNFKLHKMIAKKQGIGPLTLGEVTYQAQLVHITLQGFKSMFWKAELWYDVKTHDLLLYKANEGPHTPTSTISLISKTGELLSCDLVTSDVVTSD